KKPRAPRGIGAVGKPNDALAETGAAILAVPSLASTKIMIAFPNPFGGIVNIPGEDGTTATALGNEDRPLTVTTILTVPDNCPPASTPTRNCALMDGNRPPGFTLTNGIAMSLTDTVAP